MAERIGVKSFKEGRMEEKFVDDETRRIREIQKVSFWVVLLSPSSSLVVLLLTPSSEWCCRSQLVSFLNVTKVHKYNQIEHR